MSQRFPFFVVAFAALLSAAGGLAGCNKSNSVNGVVTFNGEPVKKGYVTFSPLDGKGQAAGGVVLEGRYSVEEIAPGMKLATVRAQNPNAQFIDQAEAERRAKEARAAGTSVKIEPVELYAPGTPGSEREVEIQTGAQTIDFTVLQQ